MVPEKAILDGELVVWHKVREPRQHHHNHCHVNTIITITIITITMITGERIIIIIFFFIIINLISINIIIITIITITLTIERVIGTTTLTAVLSVVIAFGLLTVPAEMPDALNPARTMVVILHASDPC